MGVGGSPWVISPEWDEGPWVPFPFPSIPVTDLLIKADAPWGVLKYVYTH